MLCLVTGCKKKAKKRKMCNKHYTRWWRNGDPNLRKNLAHKPLSFKLNNYTVDKNGCWEWNGYLNNKGYGTMFHDGSKKYVHRLSFMHKHNVKLKNGICVLHKCDNPRCINPDHLFKGTRKDNSADCVRKGRNTKGDKNATKLNTKLVIEILKMHESGVRQCDIIRRYRLSQSTVSAVTRRVIWKHIIFPPQ